MGSLDPAKILIILLVALIVLGPERLPRVARQLGGFWKDLSRFRAKMEEEVRNAMPDLDLPAIPAIPRGGLTGYLTGMMTSASSAASTPGAAGAMTDSAGVAEAGGEFPLGSDGVAASMGGGGAGSGTYAGTQMPGDPGAITMTGWQSSTGSARTTSGTTASLPEGIPAGWPSVGAFAPGYASGSLLSPVPVGSNAGLLGGEASFTFDEPSWN